MATSLAEMLIFARPLKAESYGLLVSQKSNIAFTRFAFNNLLYIL